MAKVDAPIDSGIIRRFKGVLDFYGLRGQVYVRSWPRSPTRVQAAGEVAAQCHLMAAMRAYWCTPSWIRDEYATLTSRMWWTRRDYFMKYYFGTIDPWNPLAWNHHPPQPSPCSGGNGHYWHLVYTNTYTHTRLRYNIDFWFDQPLRYTIHMTLEKPPYFTAIQLRSWERCELGRAGAIHDVPVIPYHLRQSSPNKYTWRIQAPFIQPEPVQAWAYITAVHPVTGHPSLSFTPWFSFAIPPRPYGWPTNALPGISFVENSLLLNGLHHNKRNPPIMLGEVTDCVNSTIQ